MDPNSAGNAYPQQENPPDIFPPPGAVPPPPPAAADYSAPPLPQYSTSPQPPATGTLTQDERLWATFMHLSGIVGGVAGMTIHFPMLCFIGPLIIWLIKRNESSFLDDQGKEALNFNITVAIAFTGAFIVCFPLWLILIGFVLWWMSWGIIGLAALILTIIAAINANNGQYYRYPFILRLIK